MQKERKKGRKSKGWRYTQHRSSVSRHCRRIEENNSPIRGTISLPRTTLFQEWKKVQCADTYRFRERHLENQDFHFPTLWDTTRRGREFERVINRVNKILRGCKMLNKISIRRVFLSLSPLMIQLLRRYANIDCVRRTKEPRERERMRACLSSERKMQKDLTLVAFEDGCKKPPRRLESRPSIFPSRHF